MNEPRLWGPAGVPGAAGTILGGALAAIGVDPVSASLASVLMTAAMHLDQLGYERRVTMAGDALAVAAAHLGGMDELIRLATLDDSRQELTSQVLEAAARSTFVARVRGLGRVLAAGLQNDTVDEAVILTAAIGDLQPPHVQMLLLMSTETTNVDALLGLPKGPGWSEHDLRTALPGFGIVLPAILRTVQRHGLLRDIGQTDYEGPRYVLSEFGHACLMYISDQADESGQSPQL